MKLKKLTQVASHKLTVVYGKPGSSKTTLINTMPGNVLIIDVDRGLASVTPDERFSIAECNTWEDFTEAMSYVKDFDSVALDHITKLQNLCYEYVLRSEGKGKTKMEIQHYGTASTLMKEYINRFVDHAYAGKNVYIIAQEKSVNIEDEIDPEVPKVITLDLQPAVASYLMASARIIAHSSRKVEKKFKNGKKLTRNLYVLDVDGNSILTLKVTRNKGIKIPNVVENPTWEKLTSLVDGVAKEDKKEDPPVTEEPPQEEEKPKAKKPKTKTKKKEQEDKGEQE